MKLSSKFGGIVAIAMAVLVSNVPTVVMAEGMISTSVIVDEMTRTETQAKLEGLLQQPDIRSELASRGLSPEEINLRLASLSPSELRDLSGQIDAAKAGGDILITILVVILIIFLIQRL